MKKIIFLTLFASFCFPALAQRKKVNTGKAERKTQELPDGNLMVLNAQTSVGYLPGNNPDIRLNGEIFVNCKNEPHRRLTVTVPTDPATVVSCLGPCAINIMAYIEDSITKVSIVTGNVTIFTGAGMKVGRDGNVALVHGQEIIMGNDPDYVQADTSWMHKGLRFQDWPLRLILARLNRCTPYEFSLPRVGMNERITTRFDYDFRIDSFLISIKNIASAFAYEINDKRIKIIPKP